MTGRPTSLSRAFGSSPRFSVQGDKQKEVLFGLTGELPEEAAEGEPDAEIEIH